MDVITCPWWESVCVCVCVCVCVGGGGGGGGELYYYGGFSLDTCTTFHTDQYGANVNPMSFFT